MRLPMVVRLVSSVTGEFIVCSLFYSAKRSLTTIRTTVQPLVTGVSHACFKRYPTEAAATKAFQEAVALGHVVY